MRCITGIFVSKDGLTDVHVHSRPRRCAQGCIVHTAGQIAATSLARILVCVEG